MPENPPLPSFTSWPSFPFEGELRVKALDPPVATEPARKGDDDGDCVACSAPDDAYIWVSERWRVRAMDRPTGLPMVLILESRSHLDLGDLPNLLAAELGVMTVRLERAIRSIEGVARVHVNRWGDGAAHLHLWFMARPYGRLQLRGTFLPLWDEILPPISESVWRENLALIAAWLADFGGRPLAEPPHIEWKAPSSFAAVTEAQPSAVDVVDAIRDGETTTPLEGPAETEAAGAGQAGAPAETGAAAAARAAGGSAAAVERPRGAEPPKVAEEAPRPAPGTGPGKDQMPQGGAEPRSTAQPRSSVEAVRAAEAADA